MLAGTLSHHERLSHINYTTQAINVDRAPTMFHNRRSGDVIADKANGTGPLEGNENSRPTSPFERLRLEVEEAEVVVRLIVCSRPSSFGIQYPRLR